MPLGLGDQSALKLGLLVASLTTGLTTSWGAEVAHITTLVDDVGGRVDWSHARDLIAYSQRGADGYYDVYVMRPDGSNRRCLTCGATDVPQLNNGQPAWHPSGNFIVFQCQDPELEFPPQLRAREAYYTQGGVGFHNNLWIVTADGRQFFQLTHIESREATLHPHFSRDGTQLLWTSRSGEGLRRRKQWMLKVADFVVDRRGQPSLRDVRRFRPHGGRQTFYESHGFSPDDQAIIFSASIGRASPFDMDIWTLDLGTGQTRQLTDSPGVWDEHGQYSPAGQHVLWISSEGYPMTLTERWGRTLKTDYWLMRADGSEKRRLTFFNEPGSPHFAGERIIAADSSWNRTGDAFVASLGVMDSGRQRSRIVRLDLTGPVDPAP